MQHGREIVRIGCGRRLLYRAVGGGVWEMTLSRGETSRATRGQCQPQELVKPQATDVSPRQIMISVET